MLSQMEPAVSGSHGNRHILLCHETSQTLKVQNCCGAIIVSKCFSSSSHFSKLFI